MQRFLKEIKTNIEKGVLMKKRFLQVVGVFLATALVMSTTTACFGLKKDPSAGSEIEISEETDDFTSNAV